MSTHADQWFCFIARAGQACIDLATSLRDEGADGGVSHGATGRVLEFGEAGSPTYAWECYVEVEYATEDLWWWFEINHGDRGWIGEASLSRGRGDQQKELNRHEWTAEDLDSALDAARDALERFIAFRPSVWP